MLKPNARWKLSQLDEVAATALSEELQVPRLIAELLVIRGITKPDEARRFLQPDESDFYDPLIMKGMEQAVERIQRAIAMGEKLWIYGDFDADGVSSTALMVQLMRHLGAQFDYYIPNRATEGYGLHHAAIDRAREEGITLVVTVDNGISAAEQVAYAKEQGIDIIVTDHHEPPEVLPDAYAVINPKIPDCPYPFKELAGVGVALKLAQALVGQVPREWIELAALGTIADLMPLVDENRLIVKRGLAMMKNSRIRGIRSLLEISGIVDREVTAGHVGFALAPRINASGRLDSAHHAVQLLVTADDQEANTLAKELDELNKERQVIVDEIFKEALLAVEQSRWHEDEVIVVVGEDWNVGVIGIVASRLLDRYYRPVIVLSLDAETGLAKGSARSIPGFDIYEALTACADLLEHYGGHQAAAGLTIEIEAISEFRAKLCELAREQLSEEDYIPLVQADLSCSVQEVNIEIIEQLERLAPFGMGNPAPRFIFSKLNIHEIRSIGKDHRHLKLVVGSDTFDTAAKLEAVGFGKGELLPYISSTAQIELLGEIGVNEWNGLRRPQLLVQDIRISEPQVYDWRGCNKQKLQEWIELAQTDGNQESNDSNGSSAGILVFDETELRLLPDSAEEATIGLWLYHDGQIEPLNAAAYNSEWNQLKDLLILSLPNDLKDLITALHQAEQLERTYAWFLIPEEQRFSVPSREGFKRIYAALKYHNDWLKHDSQLWNTFSKRSGLSPQAVRFVIDVFLELGFIDHQGQRIRLASSPKKQDLASSPLYVRQLARQKAESVLLYSTSKELTDFIIKHIPSSSSFKPLLQEQILEGIG